MDFAIPPLEVFFHFPSSFRLLLDWKCHYYRIQNYKVKLSVFWYSTEKYCQSWIPPVPLTRSPVGLTEFAIERLKYLYFGNQLKQIWYFRDRNPFTILLGSFLVSKWYHDIWSNYLYFNTMLKNSDYFEICHFFPPLSCDLF